MTRRLHFQTVHMQPRHHQNLIRLILHVLTRRNMWEELDYRNYEYITPNSIVGSSIASPLVNRTPTQVIPWRKPIASDDGYVLCPHCKKPITSYNLNRHIKMVHSCMERARCQICHKEFKNKYSLGTHMHRQHPNELDQNKQFAEWELHGQSLDYMSLGQQQNEEFNNHESDNRQTNKHYLSLRPSRKNF